MLHEIKSKNRNAKLGIISEVVGQKGNDICLRMKDSEFGESRAWFRKADIMNMFNIDYARKRN